MISQHLTRVNWSFPGTTPGPINPELRPAAETVYGGAQRTLVRPQLACRVLILFVLQLLVAAQMFTVLAGTPAPQFNERDLIKVLESGAPPEEKALACKRLAIYGEKECVPILAKLLSDEKLASWARIPLESIPGPGPGKVLREAMGKLRGNLLIGVINSLGVRRDTKAVSLLAKRLDDEDASVACASAESLGRIGGSEAAHALKSHLGTSRPEVRSAVAEGCIRCAEHLLAAGRYGQAAALYDSVRQMDVPKGRILEATRGSILARRSEGLPLLLTQLRSADKSFFAIGLSTARELPGTNVTAALAVEMRQTIPDRQPMLLLALAERSDPTARPVIFEAARNGSQKLRLTAVGIIDRSADPAALPVLLEVSAEENRELAQAAKAAIGRLPGNDVDQDIVARLEKADGKARSVLFEVAGRRGMTSVLPMLLRFADNSDALTRRTALGAIGVMGGESEAKALVTLLETEQADRRADTETALVAIISTRGKSCTPILLPLTKSADKELRMVGLRTLGATGGPEALKAIQTGTDDPEEEVREEAAQILCSWPNTWPEDDRVADALLAFAKSAKKPAHRILGVRGFLQFLLGDEKLKAEEKLRRLDEVLPLLTRPEDKRLAIAVIQKIQKPEALDLLVKFTTEPDVAQDACSAIVDIATRDKTKLSKQARQQALAAAVEKSASATVKQKAEDALQKLN